MGKVKLTDAEGIEFEIEPGIIAEVHRQGEKSSIIDTAGKETMLSNSIEDLLNKILYANFGEV